MNIRLPNSLQTFPASIATFPESFQRANPRLRLILSALAVLLVVGLVWYLVSGRSGPARTEQPPAPVLIATAQIKNVVADEHTIGTVVANATVQVTSRVDGQMESAAFQEGQIVQQGDVIFRLDPRPFQAAYEQARATMGRDQAQLVSARADAKRYTALSAQGGASAQQRDQAVATARALTATVQADKASADIAALNLQYSIIRAPVTGKTGPILIQPGNLVTANGTSPLVVITQVQPVKVSFVLPQADLARVQDRMNSHKLSVTVEVHGVTESRLTAPVDFIGNQVDAKTGTVELRATFNNQDYRLVPGQLVDISIALNNFDHVIVVPREAVNIGPDNHYVYVLDAKGDAQIRPVSVLYDDGVSDAVTGDIKAGNKVITDGQLRVLPGHPVAVMKPAKGARSGGAHAQ